MDLSDCDISGIVPQDNLEVSVLSQSAVLDQAPDDDFESLYVEDASNDRNFELLEPSSFNRESFHMGQVLRFADNSKDTW